MVQTFTRRVNPFPIYYLRTDCSFGWRWIPTRSPGVPPPRRAARTPDAVSTAKSVDVELGLSDATDPLQRHDLSELLWRADAVDRGEQQVSEPIDEIPTVGVDFAGQHRGERPGDAVEDELRGEWDVE
jgi:hypothetical protein